MSFLTELSRNKLLLCAVSGWFLAQLIKTLLYLIIERRFNLERMFGSGGMPSSHSATVCALSTAAALEYGGASPQFAISAVFAFIVMYDACGVRLETGRQATILNDIQETLQLLGQPLSAERKLKELVGHTPLQVAIGALLGVAVGFLTLYLF